MQACLLAREAGELAPDVTARTITSELLGSFAPAPQHRFDGDGDGGSGRAEKARRRTLDDRPHTLRAHGAGVNSLALDKFDGRILLSGGAEGSIKLWDLEDAGNPHDIHTFSPLGTIPRASPSGGPTSGAGHTHGVTHLAFYPFDPDAFLSSSYDKTIKLWSTQQATLSAEFDLNAVVYSHATSPIADHLLVAVASQHPHVRLVDLRSGSGLQALVSNGGPVLAVAWSPRKEHILVSGHADGKVRVWDVRRAGGVVAQLDHEDALGVVHRFRHACAAGIDQVSHSRDAARAHEEAVNGLHWTDDGRYIVSAGLDRRVRVWDADTGANTLTSFGSLVQNQHSRTVNFFTSPSGLSMGRPLLFWPNDQEILAFNLHDGKLVTRMRSPGPANPAGSRGGAAGMGSNRITSMVWRGAGGGGRQVGPVMGGGNSIGAIYSAHADGQIRAWSPQVPGPDDLDENEQMNEDEQVQRKKRKAIDNAYRSLMGKNITFI
jgi:DNA excision repair protein ERCC-8